MNFAQKYISEIEKMQLRIFKRMMNLPPYTPNAFIYSECKVKKIEEILNLYKLKFIGHCLNNTEMIRNIMEIRWKKSEFLQNVEQVLQKYSINEELLREQNNLVCISLKNEWQEKLVSLINDNSLLKIYRESKDKNSKIWLNTQENKVRGLFQSGAIMRKNLSFNECGVKITLNHYRL